MWRKTKSTYGQAGCRPKYCFLDHIYTLGTTLEGRKNPMLTTYCFFDVQQVMTQYRVMGCEKNCGKFE